MTPENKLIILKDLIDEENYPTYEDEYLLQLINTNENLIKIAHELILKKSTIPGLRLGDVEIIPPKDHFYSLALNLRNKVFDEETGEITSRKARGKVVTRYDGRN